MAATASPSTYSRRFLWAGLLIGFALGGFFDGILLHQILQWHHLLSGLEAAGAQDLRFQVMADGVFHGLMYVIAAAGLWLLFRSRAEFSGARPDRHFVPYGLIGVGAWHVIDAVLSHWILGIHRIRMDVPNPLFWDLLWLAIFGLVPLAAGLWMRRAYPREVRAAPIAIVVIAAGLLAALPPRDVEGPGTVTVVLRPDVRPGEFLARVQRSDMRVLWSDRAGGVWVLTRDPQQGTAALYRKGALYVAGSILPAGCAAWLRSGA
jgi:uncharacterized membrane protein